MKNSIRLTHRLIPLLFIVTVLGSCQMESETENINKKVQDFMSLKGDEFPDSENSIPLGNQSSRKWNAGEGWVKAENVAVELKDPFGNLLATEYHTYDAKLKDGVLEGTFQLFAITSDGSDELRLDGEITCLVFEEDCKTARITGLIQNSTIPFLIGRYAKLIVVDNGETGDLSSDLQFGGQLESAEYHCLVGAGIESFYSGDFLVPVGDIKVKSMECFGNAVGD